jgi:predicted nucleic acid-binding protein
MIDANSQVYVDANVFIYFIEGSAEFEGRAKRFFNLADDRRASLWTSELTIAECLYGAHRLGSRPLAAAYVSLFDDKDLLRLLPIDRAILKSAAAVGAATRSKLIDAVHLASAVAASCEVFVTNDRSIRAPAGLKVLMLPEVELP